MKFRIPGQDINVRVFEKVETVDPQYQIWDLGIEQADGSIDSVVVGGSFSYAKSLFRSMDEKKEAAKAEAQVTPDAPAAA